MAEIGIMKKLTIGGSTYTIPEYNLPIASDSTLGGVKIGTGLSINSTTGVLSATGLDYDEADPVFVASAAYGITQNDITNWNSKTSNTGTITEVKTTAGAHSTIDVTSGKAEFNVPTKTSHLTNDSNFVTSSGVTSIATSSPISGGTITTTGTISHATSGVGNTINTAGFYKFKYDTYGHVTGVSSVTASDITGLVTIPDVSGKIDTAGTGLSKSGTTLNHSNSVTAQTTQAVYPIKIDAQGHISAYGSAVTIPTDEKVSTAAITAGTTYYPILGTDTTSATTKYYDANAFSYKTNNSEKTATLIIGNNLATSNSNYRKASIELYSNTKSGMIQMENLTHNQTYVLPDTSGTFAMVSDVPKIEIVRW